MELECLPIPVQSKRNTSQCLFQNDNNKKYQSIYFFISFAPKVSVYKCIAGMSV